MEAERRIPEVPPLPLPNLQLALGQEIRQEIRGTEAPMGEGGQNVSKKFISYWLQTSFSKRNTRQKLPKKFFFCEESFVFFVFCC